MVQLHFNSSAHRNRRFCRFMEARKTIDLTFMIDATNHCQLGCRYCYFGAKGQDIMDISRVFAATCNVAAIFRPKLKSVKFHYMGGEPLLAWEEINSLNAIAREFFELDDILFSWSLTSNLIELDKEKAEDMIREKAGIHCSIDGPKRVHNKNRPYRDGRPSFDDVRRRIPLALRITPNDTARVTVCPEDVEEIPEIVDAILRMGFQTVGLFPAYNMTWPDMAVDGWANGILKAYETIIRQFEGKSLSTMIKPMRKESESFSSFLHCGAGRGLWGIDVRGNLYFCHHLTNISDCAVIDATHASPEQILVAIKKSTLPPQGGKFPVKCESCSARLFCNGGCWVSNFLVNGDSDLPKTTECKLRRATAGVLAGKPGYEILPQQRNSSSLNADFSGYDFSSSCDRCDVLCISDGGCCDGCVGYGDDCGHF